jgi:hypothetical protein
VSDAHDALVALARDLVEEISAGRAIELATAAAGQGAGQGGPSPWSFPLPPTQLPRGAQAVHPQLGHHLARLPGDTISSHAYKHLGMQPPIAAG